MVSQFLVVLLLATIFETYLSQDLYEEDFDLYEEDFDISEEDLDISDRAHLNPSIFVGDPPKEIKLDKYYDSTKLEQLLKKLNETYSNITKLDQIGLSVEKTPLYVVEISRNVREKREKLKPMFKFVANMHGDETVGYALMVFLIQYLVYCDGHDDRVSRLLNTTDIWIVPTLNPDGLRRSKVGHCESPFNFVGRYNAHGVDLNRDFPDQFQNNSDSNFTFHEPETLAMMQFILSHPFVLSGNLHGGAVVASYPFDSSDSYEKSGVESLTPDNAFFVKLAKDYASRNPEMASGTACGNNFPGGITNGNYWYKVSGGMQDYNYVNSNCFDMTMELSCCKYPWSKRLRYFWRDNFESLLQFMESTRRGAYGLVTDKKGQAVRGAVVQVAGNWKQVKTTPDGEYWRLLVPGSYNLTASAPGCNDSFTNAVNVTEDNPYVRSDFTLHECHFDPNSTSS